MNKPRRNRLKAAAAAFASNAVNGNLRRAQLSFLWAWTAEWAFTVALGIVAYRDGGATAVGGRSAAYGAIGGGGPASRSARGPGASGTSPRRRVYSSRGRNWG